MPFFLLANPSKSLQMFDNYDDDCDKYIFNHCKLESHAINDLYTYTHKPFWLVMLIFQLNNTYFYRCIRNNKSTKRWINDLIISCIECRYIVHMHSIHAYIHYMYMQHSNTTPRWMYARTQTLRIWFCFRFSTEHIKILF